MSTLEILPVHAVRAALSLRDLTDPASGPHALQLLVEDLEQALVEGWRIPLRRQRANPVVPVEDNYDRLRYPPDAAARDARYSRYLSPELMLRAHTTAAIPDVLERLAVDPPDDVLLSCPGITYRRDTIDRQHVGEPHQLDLWRVRSAGPRLSADDLTDMVGRLMGAALPRREWRMVPSAHSYTVEGRQIDVANDDTWTEVGECGLAHPALLAAAGLPACASGLALGVGLDRLFMLRKGH